MSTISLNFLLYFWSLNLLIIFLIFQRSTNEQHKQRRNPVDSDRLSFIPRPTVSPKIKLTMQFLRRILVIASRISLSSYGVIVRVRVILKELLLVNTLNPDDHTLRATDTPGFKPFTRISLVGVLLFTPFEG